MPLICCDTTLSALTASEINSLISEIEEINSKIRVSLEGGPEEGLNHILKINFLHYRKTLYLESGMQLQSHIRAWKPAPIWSKVSAIYAAWRLKIIKSRSVSDLVDS